MQLTTRDLHFLNQCPKRWTEDPELRNYKITPVRNLVRQLFLLKEFQKGNWDFFAITQLWDKIYWKNKAIDKESSDASCTNLLNVRKVYEWFLKQNSSRVIGQPQLCCFPTTDVKLVSSGDFAVVKENEIEVWIYSRPINDMDKSIIPAAEYYILGNRLRDVDCKQLKIVFVYQKKAGVTSYKTIFENKSSLRQGRLGVFNLIDRAQKKVRIPQACLLCETCEIKCP